MAADTVAFTGLNDKYIGLGIPTIILGILAGVCLQKTRRFRKMPAYFYTHFSFFKGKSPALPVVVTVLYYIFLATPLILLIIWVSLLGARHGPDPALPVLFVGLFVAVLFLPSYSKFFYFKCIGLLVCFVIAQFLIIGLNWAYKNDMSFYALTALMLTLNGVFVAICLWLIDGSCWNISTHTPIELKQEIIKEVKIWKKEEEPPEIINGGIYGYLTSIRLVFRGIIIGVSYLLSLIILLVYSIIGKRHSNTAYQATVNSCAVITTDIITLMLILITKKAGTNPIFNAFVSVAVRVCIIAFSGEYWFAGYCLLYLILFVYISGLIINKYYPLYEQFPSGKVLKTNIFRMPETPLLFLLIMFSGLVYYMGNDNGQTLPIASIKLGEQSYPFWALGVACVLLGFAVGFYMISGRIIQRSLARVRTTRFYYLGCQFCSEYYFFLLCSYVFLIVLGLYFYFKTGTSIVWASCVFLPVVYQAFVIFYTNWKENDYLLLGDMKQYNKKIKKKKERDEKIKNANQSAIKKMGEEGEENMNEIDVNANLLRDADVEKNFMVEDYDGVSEYSEWRDEMNIAQAFRDGRLLPTDKKILISLPVMFLCLIGYSIAFFFVADRDTTAFTVSVEILFIFLCFIPTKRYFSTFEMPGVGQIISFALGIVLNYGFGAAAYAAKWNRSPAYTSLWVIINLFALSVYAAFCLVRDKGLILASVIVSVVSMVLSFGTGIILIAWFKLVGVGVGFLAVAFFYTYFLTVYIIYLKMNKSVHFVIYPITLVLIVGGCFAVMIYGFVDDSFDDFYGFSVTYLAINLLILIYATFRILSDIRSRFDKPNFYSAYGSPIFKYNPSIKSAVENMRPMHLWLGSWFMYYVYTILMSIFIFDPNYSVSAACIFFIVAFLTFVYFTTYNLHRAAKIKDQITNDVLSKSWEEVLEVKEKSLGNFLDLDMLQEQLKEYEEMKERGKNEAPSAVKIQPKSGEDKMQGESENKIESTPHESTKDLGLIIFDLEGQIDKARQNDKILLVDFWINIIFRCENVRKRKMLSFTNFIRDCGEVLADGGIAIVLDSALYDLESVYNQAHQEYETLSPLQKIYFMKQKKIYEERKGKEEKEKDEINRKENEDQLKRQKELEQRLMDNDKDEDPDLPPEKMRDSPAKLQKLKETLTTVFTDNDFRANNDIIPADLRSELKGWKRPTPDSVIVKDDNVGMSVRQGYIGDCYLISAIGVLGLDRIRQLISAKEQGPNGAYMVKFNKMNKDIYVIIDDQFPVSDNSIDNEWLFGRCEDKKQLFCNILEKAYAKLYGGYNNIVGGKVALALSDMTGGFPEQIELKKYQESNTNQIFDKMLSFKKSGYLMGAGSPPNAQGDSVDIDGIYQGHAYLILDVRNLDGNKLIKLRNPHGNNSKESQLDWSDDSPKWNKRLKGLVGEEMGDDGAFWMGLDDFVYCYRALYVCRLFDDTWVKVGPFNGQWKGESAAGLRSKSGSADLTKNPHFGIHVKKACTLFVELSQNELEGGRAKNKIFFMVQRNSGRRIEAPSTNKMAGMSGPAINSKTISKQINLTADSFPFTFSLMTAIYETGVQGSFSLTLYCNDKNIRVIEDPDFDR